jgi:TonB family protein
MRAALLILVVSCLGAAVEAAGAEQVTGGVVYKPGNGVSAPRVIHDVKPQYAADAMKARVQGVVELEFVVLPDGTVGDVKVVRSLHASLDKEAVKAVKQWQFKPGTKDGEPVAVLVSAELTFTLGKRSGQTLLPTLPLGTVETPPTAAAPAPGVVYKPGDGVSPPRVTRQVKPQYPADAMKAKIEGRVQLELVVLPDGTVGDVTVVRSLHTSLDLEAIKAVKQWRFEPGTRDGKPVPVQVEIELTFTLR